MPESSRRKNLQHVQLQQSSHAGLWLDKYVKEQLKSGEKVAQNQQTPQTQVIEEVSRIEPPAIYTSFYDRWNQMLAAAGARTREATTQGRMVVGLGAESVLETAIALHRTYGVPYIPGSALKGLAGAYARQRLEGEQWRAKRDPQHALFGDYYKVVFGTTASAGYITFYDALYIPGTGHEQRPLHPDVITVHHPDYYQKGSAAPADWDNPTPVPFLSATGKYLIALSGPLVWVEAAFEILGWALAEEGIGAKTSSGYGRMLLQANPSGLAPWCTWYQGHEGTSAHSNQATQEQPNTSTALPQVSPSLPQAPPPVNPSERTALELIERTTTLQVKLVANTIKNLYDQFMRIEPPPSDELRQQFAAAVIAKVHESGQEKSFEKKDWFQQLK